MNADDVLKIIEDNLDSLGVAALQSRLKAVWQKKFDIEMRQLCDEINGEA